MFLVAAKRFVALLLCVLSLQKEAFCHNYHSSGHNKAEFELVDIKANKFVKSSAFNGKCLALTLWGQRCESCLKEVDGLNEAAAYLRERNCNMIVIAIIDGGENNVSIVKKIFNSAQDFAILKASHNVEVFSRSIGNAKNTLPYSVFLKKDLSICYGGAMPLNKAFLIDAIDKCK